MCLLELGRGDTAVAQHLRRAVARDPSFAAAAELLHELEERAEAAPPAVEEAERAARCAWGAAGEDADAGARAAAGAEREPAPFRTELAVAELRAALQEDRRRSDPPDSQRVARWASAVLAEFSLALAAQGGSTPDTG